MGRTVDNGGNVEVSDKPAETVAREYKGLCTEESNPDAEVVIVEVELDRALHERFEALITLTSGEFHDVLTPIINAAIRVGAQLPKS